MSEFSEQENTSSDKVVYHPMEQGIMLLVYCLNSTSTIPLSDLFHKTGGSMMSNMANFIYLSAVAIVGLGGGVLFLYLLKTGRIQVTNK